MPKTLIEKALEVRPKVRITEVGKDRQDLAIGWLQGQYGISAVSKVIYGHTGGMEGYVLLARALRQAFKEGRIKVVS